MKIVYVTVSFPFGAGETYLIPELEELTRQGHQVLITPLWPGRRVIHPDAKEFVGYTRWAPLVSFGVLREAAIEFGQHFQMAARMIRRLVTVRNFRMLAVNAAVIPKGLWISRVAREWRADHIHAYWGSGPASAVLIAGECTGIPWSFTGHRHDLARDNLLSEKMRHAAFVRVISESGLRMLRSAVPALAWKTFVLHLGIPIRALSITAAKEERMTALCPASLVAVKGHRYLIEAVAMLRKSDVNVQLWLAGEGELRGQIERQIRDLRLHDCVRVLGQMAHDALLALYERGEIDVVVLPSIDLGGGYHEGIPVALMEAMASGIPVVATETGGIPELIGDGAGMLVPPANPHALAAALAQLEASPALRRSLGLAGRKRVEQSFELTKMVKELVRKFDQAAPRHGAHGGALPSLETEGRFPVDASLGETRAE
jgi:colanic acid/amylovoran biosynthesis glycosyltransferase